ncbi:hypothetical protein Tcan_09536, partial [Toxocara canis]
WIWATFGTFIFVFAPTMALMALLYSDIEWCFPSLAPRRGSPAVIFLLVIPITIFPSCIMLKRSSASRQLLRRSAVKADRL